MKLTKETKILIIGLGVIGGSYAKALSNKGYNVSCITKETADVRYGLEHGMIGYGTTEVEPELVSSAELIIFALYPKAFVDWVSKYQKLFSPGVIITDVTGIKSEIVYKVQDMLREDVEFIAAHPMAGRERSGVEFADPSVFNGANYIVTPTEKNTRAAVRLCKQLGEVLYVKLGLPHKNKKNKNGFSTDAETLEELRQYSPIIDDILEYRQVSKLRGTYAAQLPKVADSDGRIHTDFKQALTATGRLSSADPNLQNIPIKTKMGREMRRYFISREGYSLVDADYSQIELRLLAHISEDYNMSEAFRNGEDIHRKTAAAVFGIPEESVNEEMRKRAKAVNFGIVYGISGFSLGKDIGTTTSEASKYIKSYLLNYPSIDAYLERVPVEAKENGYTETLFGRRRYIPELNAANGMLRAFGKRVAMNAPIQGAAADIMKLAMINVDKALSAASLDDYESLRNLTEKVLIQILSI